jgi:hypothetical protein
MHPPDVCAEALALVAAGLNDCEVARRTGVPRRTILDWRRPTYVRRSSSEVCPRCWRDAKRIRFTAEDYAELLGLYLGDGYISAGPRTYRLRITLDAKYPQIISETEQLLKRSLPDNRVDVLRTGVKGNCVNVSAYSSHLPCLLPQHGPGKKHERPIVLEDWQRELLDVAPWGFIRGCIRSDGSCFINRTDIHRDRPYEYLSYEFSNKSKDVIDLFLGACKRVDVFAHVTNSSKGGWKIRINRRASVGLMLEHVGRKT